MREENSTLSGLRGRPRPLSSVRGGTRSLSPILINLCSVRSLFHSSEKNDCDNTSGEGRGYASKGEGEDGLKAFTTSANAEPVTTAEDVNSSTRESVPLPVHISAAMSVCLFLFFFICLWLWFWLCAYSDLQAQVGERTRRVLRRP
jgi:hypothetical protein